MKSIFSALILLVACSTVSLAQCDKKVTLHSSKTQHLDSNGAVQETQDEQTTVQFDKSDITVSITNPDHDEKMSGKIKSNTCNWNVPFKEGKTVLNTTLNNENGEGRDFTLTIEGKNGKVTLMEESPSIPEKIKLDIEKFEAVN